MICYSLLAKKCVKLCYKRIGIGAVNSASVRDRLTSGMRAAKAVHSDLEEESCGLYVMIIKVFLISLVN